jgi:aspartyl-tRNA(Asn)/glutamyl-tRNA(Gln) amidotransferase subunit B
MPGVLPVLNRRAIELAMRMALRTGGEIQEYSLFARKNYFYPDLPKGYQISMYEYPLIKGGFIEVDTDNGKRNIRLNRIHLEEDAGKLIHVEGDTESYFDVNRCGVPLIEIVTEPDFETLDEVSQFLTKLREMIVFSDVSIGDMSHGNLRVDANISIRPVGQKELGIRTEIKNMNSFVNAIAAMGAEIDRQTALVEDGGTVMQETLLYDADRGTLSSMRSKEEAHDYRYFPEPDLVPVMVDEKWVEKVRSELPELRDEKKTRFVSDYGLPEYDADILTVSPEMSRYFEETVAAGADSKAASNWIMGEVMRKLNETQSTLEEFKISSANLAKLLSLIDNNTISGSIAKTVFEEMAETGGGPEAIVEAKGLRQISDSGELESIVRKIVDSHPDEVQRYREGHTKLLGFFVGQAMKETKGKANPKEVNRIIMEMLS